MTKNLTANMNSLYEITVFLEDTDAGGYVYHANYLKFFERARTTLLRNKGFDHNHFVNHEGLMFVVRECHINFLKPAKLGDTLQVDVQYESSTHATATITQSIYKGDITLAKAKIMLAFVNQSGKIVRIPENIIKILKH